MPKPNKKSFFASRLPHDYLGFILKILCNREAENSLNQEVARYFAQ